MAECLIDLKLVSDDEIIEVKAWRAPKSRHYPQGVNYRMVYIKAGRRLLGYDNNTHEGHHKHLRGEKTPIRFESLGKLFSRFITEIGAMRENSE